MRRARVARRHRRTTSESSSAGFTLIELVVAIGIMPIVIGALAVGILSVFTLQSSVSKRLTDSGDAQVVSVNYSNDVQSAAYITTASSPVNVPGSPTNSPAPCGSGYQVLGLLLGNGNEISYTASQSSSGTTYNLFRNVCSGGSVTSSAVVSRDAPASMINPATPPVTITCTTPATSTTCNLVAPTNAPAYTLGWQPTLGVTGVTFKTTEPQSNYTYQLVAVPTGATSSSQLAQVSSSSTGCGFALPSTGTYAGTLCFVNFAPWNTQTGAKNISCNSVPSGFSTPIPMSAALANTPFTLDFCVSAKATTSGGQAITGPTSAGAACGVAARSGYDDITAVPLPTYSCPPGSEAFLGNNGFYTGVPGDPALYTVDQGSTATVDITNIVLLSSNGVATGWQLATGDAESTDATESITWTSDQKLSLIPNSTTSPVGNACMSTGTYAPPSYNPNTPGAGGGLSGVGTTTVECSASAGYDKTGTAMLAASTPSSLMVTMVGQGLQAMFMGVLLP